MSEINWPATILAALIGGAASLGAGYLTFMNTDRGHDLKMVEISLSILRGESEAEKSTMARTFALRALEKYSGVQLSDAEFSAWVSGGTVPFVPTSLSSIGRGWASSPCFSNYSAEPNDCEVVLTDDVRSFLNQIITQSGGTSSQNSTN